MKDQNTTTSPILFIFISSMIQPKMHIKFLASAEKVVSTSWYSLAIFFKIIFNLNKLISIHAQSSAKITRFQWAEQIPLTQAASLSTLPMHYT